MPEANRPAHLHPRPSKDHEHYAVAPDVIRACCLALHLQRAARAASRAYDQALRAVALSSGQYTILVALAQHPALPIVALAKELAMDRTTLIANLKPLARRGLIEDVPTEASRLRHVGLTREGRALLAHAIPLWVSVQRRLQAHLQAPETTYDDLRALARA